MPRYLDHIGVRLDYPRGNGPDPCLSYKLHRNLGARIGLLQVVDELGQILDAVDVVVGWWRDEGNPGDRVTDLCDLYGDLMSGKLAPLARFRSLGHLDLQLNGRCQILGRHSEARRCHLFDGTVSPIPIRLAVKAHGILSPLTAAAFSSETIHGNGYGLMRLPAEGPVRHGARGKSPHDVLDRFNLLKWNWPCRLESQKIADRRRRTLVHSLGISLVISRRAAFDHFMQRLENVRVEGMILACFSVAIESFLLKPGLSHTESRFMKHQDLPGDLFQAGPFDARRCPGEILIDHSPVDPHGFKYLSATIAGEGRDPHLGHDLQDPVFNCLLVIFQCLLTIQSPQRAFLPIFGGVNQKMSNRLKGNVGMDHAGPIAKQTGKVVFLPGLPGLGDNACTHPLSLPYQVMVHRSHSKQHGNRRVRGIHPFVAQDKYCFRVINRADRCLAQAFQGRLKTLGTFSSRKQSRQNDRTEGQRALSAIRHTLGQAF